MQGTFLVLGAMMLLTIAGQQGRAAVDGIWLQVTIDCLLLAGGMLLVRHLLRRRDPYRAQTRFAGFATAMLVAVYGWWVLGLGLADASPSLLLGVLPLVALLSLQWWLGAELGSHEPVPPRLRRALIAQRWRFGLLLPLLLIAAHDLLTVARVVPPWEHWFGTGAEAMVGQVLDLGLLLVLAVGLAPILAAVWRARRIEGAEAMAMQRLCERAGVRVWGLRQWPRFELPFYNAMAVGLVGPFRAIFISSDLLRQLSEAQRDAVIGHEIGHLRHNHHALFIILMLLATLLGAWLGWYVELLVIAPLVPAELASSARMLLIGVYLLLIIRIVFGIISRACERQADLVGAELAGSPQAMQKALTTVARLAGQALDAPSWRHHSIAARIAFLERVHRDPGLALWHHWYVRMLRLILILLLFAVLLLQFGLGVQQPDLASMRDDDPVLDRAVNQALAGESKDLYSLIADSESFRRRRIALAILNGLEQLDDQSQTIDPRDLRRHVPLLRLFLRASTGDEQLQLAIRNAVAYGLVAGSLQAPIDDLNDADTLYVELDKAVEETDAAHIRDTLGSIDLRLGRFQKAAAHFRRALELLPADSEDPSSRSFRELLERRLSAAEDETRALPLEWTDQTAGATGSGEEIEASPDGQAEQAPGSTTPAESD